MDDILSLQIYKLGHEVEEIRVRALNNIITKIDLGLITYSELFDSPNFVQNIVRWFTFPVVPHKEEVLKLILNLVQQVDMGGVLLLRYDPKFQILEEATRTEYRELFDELCKTCGHLLRSQTIDDLSGSLAISSKSEYEEVDWLIWKSLPKVELAPTDVQLLASLKNSLVDSEQSSYASNFLSTIMLHDFPPQLFLQQPDVLHVLLDVIHERKTNAHQSFHCLKTLASVLNKQISFSYDPNLTTLFCCQKRDVGTELSPSLSSGSRESSLKSIQYTLQEISLKDKENVAEEISLFDFVLLVFECVVRTESYRQLYLIKETVSLLKYIAPDFPSTWKHSPQPRVSSLISQLTAAAHRSQVMEAVDKLELEIMTGELLSTLVPVDMAPIAFPLETQEALYHCLLDPVISILFSKVHSLFSSYVEACKYSPTVLLKEMVRICNCLQAGANFIIHHKDLRPEEAIELFHDAIDGIEYHQQYAIISQFLKLVHTRWNLTGHVEENCKKCVLRLLAAKDTNIRIFVLTELSKLVEEILGPGQAVKGVPSNIQNLFPILIDSRILIEIISFGLTSHNKEIVNLSENIITLIIKSRCLLSDRNWCGILSHLTPTFPYLQAFGSNSTTLGKAILHLFDPDFSTSVNLSPIQVIQGNVRFLVSKDTGCRDEAISRLMYLLEIPSRPLNLVLPHDPISAIRNLSGTYEVSSLIRVLELLNEPEVDYKVIKSALTQLSVMTEDVMLHETFLKQNGVDLILGFLDTSNERYREYFGPGMTILKNIAKFNSKTRQQFASNEVFFKNAVKGLFMFDVDWRVQRDVSQFLVLLSYSDVIHTQVDQVSLPDVILQKIRSPFPPFSHAQTSLFCTASYKDDLLLDSRSRSLLSLHWAIGCSESIDGLIKVGSCPLPAPLLPLSKHALLDLKKCHPMLNIAQALEKLATATSHRKAFEGLASLHRYLSILPAANNFDLSDLPWEAAFSRYITTPPSSTSDQELLRSILEKFNTHFGIIKDYVSWLNQYFQEPSPVLFYLLKQTSSEVSTLKKDLCMEMLQLLEQCMLVHKEGWEKISGILVEALNDRHSHQFYSIGVVERLVKCMVVGCLPSRQIPCRGGAKALFKLLPAFYSACPYSHMGLNISRVTLICLNQLLPLSQKHKGWEQEWNDVHYICDMLPSHDLIVKSSALQLLCGLAYSPLATSQLLSSFENLWGYVLGFLLDPNEINLVRQLSANLCSNILYHQPNKEFITICETKGLFRSLTDIVNCLFFEECLPRKLILRLQTNNVNHLPGSDSSNSNAVGVDPVTTPSLLLSACRLVINLINLDSNMIKSMASHNFSPSLFRYMGKWCTDDVLSDLILLELYSKICKLLYYCPSHAGRLNKEALCSLVWILQPSSFCVNDLEEQDLCDLWTSSLKLLGALLKEYPDIDLCLTMESLKTICRCIVSSDNSLQLAALSCISHIIPVLNSKGSEMIVESLMSVWNKRCISQGSLNNNITKQLKIALASLLAASHAATEVALSLGLLDSLVLKLRETYVNLTVLPPDIPRNKKCNAVLENLSVDVGLVTNLLAGSEQAKTKSFDLGLADCLHKLWAWCLLDFSLLASLLQALITFTSNSPLGASSLVLTSTMAGVGQRKTPSASSILHASLSLLSKDIYPLNVKKRVLELASHACQAQESRVILFKSHILRDFSKFRSEKKTNTSDEIELSWINFFNVFSSYQEGQTVLLKNEDLFEYFLGCVSSNKPVFVQLGLSIFRNLSFYSVNRSRILSSDILMRCLAEKLLNDSVPVVPEKKDIAVIIWCLSANSQKVKQTIRNYGFHSNLKLVSTLVDEYTEEHTLLETVISVIKA